MYLRHIIIFVTLGLLLLGSACSDKAPVEKADPNTVAPLVFLGTVTGSKSKNGLTLSTVRIDKLYLLRGTFETGKEIDLGGKDIPAKGQYVFHVDPVQFSKRVMATLLKTEPAKVLTKDEVSKLARLRRKQELTPVLKASELIVTGEIVALEKWSGARTESEHDPMLTWATLKAEENLKGQGEPQLRILFAASMDVQWYKSPKPTVGEKGVFLLRKGLTDHKNIPSSAWTLLRPGNWLKGDDVAIAREVISEGGAK